MALDPADREQVQSGAGLKIHLFLDMLPVGLNGFKAETKLAGNFLLIGQRVLKQSHSKSRRGIVRHKFPGPSPGRRGSWIRSVRQR